MGADLVLTLFIMDRTVETKIESVGMKCCKQVGLSLMSGSAERMVDCIKKVMLEVQEICMTEASVNVKTS